MEENSSTFGYFRQVSLHFSIDPTAGGQDQELP